MDRLKAFKALIHDAVDATTRMVGEGNASSARWVNRAARWLPMDSGEAVHAVAALQGAVTEGVLASVRGVNRLTEALSDAALEAVPWPEGPPRLLPVTTEALWSPFGAIDMVLAMVNGAIGDHLRRKGNALDLGMLLRDGDGVVPREGDWGGPTGRLVVLVHGLAATELCWAFGADEALGDGAANVGTRLAEARGATLLYARYNTGVGVDDNGAALASRMDAVCRSWPVPVTDVVLVGHSMGGLVARAAARHGRAREEAWRPALSVVATIGTPHLGAPLAAAGHVAATVLSATDLPVTRILGMILDGRSQGVKDLRDGDADALGPLTDDVAWVLVAGSASESTEGLGSRTVGDLLVTVRSAHGPDSDPDVRVTRQSFGGVLHQTVQCDPRVVQAVVDGVMANPPAPDV